MACRAQRKHALFRPTFFLIAASTADGGIDIVPVKRLLERHGLHRMGMQRRPRNDGVDTCLEAFFVDVDYKIQSQPFCGSIAESNHVPEFPRRVDVQKREWHAARLECLDRKVKQDT